ncbi:site-specific DNA-methyltransferase [Aquabacterium sp. G14]|uniref:site-specific DNA-methyltransferase n=1 Tax=Aquabacterium sp. G14 TaxID=3130164 RepID=UPI0030D79A8D
MKNTGKQNLLDSLGQMSAPELRRLLTEHLTRQKLGLYWERDAIEHDKALNANVVLPRLVPEWSHTPEGCTEHRNLIIEGDNFDSLRLLRATHAGKVRVIYIDPPYNTGNKDWVYNDSYVGQNDRWRHSQWLEFLYQRLTLARDLLTSDGVILVSINDENRARLELLMDEVFPGRRVGCFVWRSRTGGNDTKGAFFSDNHEHVLVYANPGFRFSGDEKSYSMYKYQEGDRLYRLSDLTKAHDYRERPNTYYPIHDPLTDTFYPCNPQRVWAYASEKKVKDGQKIRGDTIETLIAKKLIWFPPEQRVEVFETLEELQDAIQRRDVPMSGSTPLLFDGMPDLDFWVGRRVGYGRPAFKRFKEGLKNENQPISSWLTPRQEQDTVVEGLNMPVVGTTEEGSKELKEVMGDKAFPYPKPPSLLKGLLAQATRPDDIVLDFFAGSGTTGQVVMELNVEDSGRRRFILCSSTEANDKEPAKNLCRDVCAERMRRVMQGYGDKDALSVAQGGEFAYLQLDKLDAADVALDATADHASTLLTMRHAAAAPVTHQSGAVRLIAKGADWLMALCPTVNAQVLDELCGLPDRHHVARLVVYAPRPKSLAALLAERGIEAQVHALRQALIQGQGGRPQ